MKRIKILQESVSPIVYHYTKLKNAVQIYRNNEFQLSPSFGEGADRAATIIALSDRMFYLSVSRVKWSGYARAEFSESNYAVNLVLDGKKFNQRFKGGPVDYWGPNFRRVASPEQRLRLDENEERIITDDPVIENAAAYTLEVHVYIPPQEDEYVPFEASRIAKITRRWAIPTYYYLGNASAFKLLDKRKAKDYSEKSPRVDNLEILANLYNASNRAHDIKDLFSRMKGGYEYARIISDMVGTIEGFPEITNEELLETWSYNIKDMVRQINNEIHNIGKGSMEGRQFLNELGRIMKKERVRDIEKLFPIIARRVYERKNK